MKISALKVGAHAMPVKEVTLDDVGGFSPSNLVIEVASGYGTRRQADILVHEVTHALIHDSGYAFEDEDAEEAFVAAFAPRLTALLADNPDAIGTLLDMLA